MAKKEPFKELHGLYEKLMAHDISEEATQELDQKISALEKKLPPEQVAFFHFVRMNDYGQGDPRSWIHRDYLTDLLETIEKKNPVAYQHYLDMCQEYSKILQEKQKK